MRSQPDRVAQAPVFLIAEAGVNHGGSLATACALVEAAARAGADAVKFQSFKTEALVTSAAPKAPYQRRSGASGETQAEMLKRLELSVADHRALVEACGSRGIEFLSSPFDRDSLRMLVEECGVHRIKLGSGELTHGVLLWAAALTGLPLIVSTGMATLPEVEDALGLLALGMLDPSARPSEGACAEALRSDEGREVLRGRVTLLHCTTAYPTLAPDVHLRAMDRLAETFDVPVGYSDHTLGLAVPWAAVARGAAAVEKHLTLDRDAAGPDHAASATPEEWAALVAGVRTIEAALGRSEKRPCEAELPQRQVARRSLVAARSLERGVRLGPEDLVAKRPAGGVSPMRLWSVIGRVLLRDLEPDEALGEDDLAPQEASR